MTSESGDNCMVYNHLTIIIAIVLNIIFLNDILSLFFKSTKKILTSKNQ